MQEQELASEQEQVQGSEPEPEQNPVEEQTEEEDSVFSKEELKYLEKMSLHDRSQLLFSILYVSSRQMTEDDLQPLIQYQAKNPVTLEQLVTELNHELDSRNSPYVVNWHKELHYLEIILKQEHINEIAFSEYFFKIENLSRDKYKILSYITFKLYLEHSHCSVEDLLAMKNTFGFDELKLAKIIYDLELENLIYQVKRGSTSDLHLTNQFFEIMNLPMDRFQLGPVLRNELIKVLQGDVLEEEDYDADIIEEELEGEAVEEEEEEEEQVEEESTTPDIESLDKRENPDDDINDLLKSLEKES